MLIKDIMSQPVVTIEPNNSALDAYRLMVNRKIRRLPVVHKDRLAGIVTERDIRSARPSSLADLPPKAADEVLRTTPVEKIMTKKVITVISDDPLEQAALLMREHKVGGIPVMEKDKLVGIVTETDAFRLLTSLFGAEPGYFQVVLLDTKETRRGVMEAFKKYETKIRSILFSPKYPEIVMVFKTPKGEAETQEILDSLRRYSFQILDWHLFESKEETLGTVPGRTKEARHV